MATKKLEDILKEIEEQIAMNKEMEDDIPKLLDEAEGVENGIKAFIEYSKNIIKYTADNVGDASLELAGTSLTKSAPKFIITTLIGSFVAAHFDYASDLIEQENNISELAQGTYDYITDYNEKVKAAKEKIEWVDDDEKKANDLWKKIQDYVDKYGKLENPANRDELKDAIEDMNKMVYDANIRFAGDRIQDYANLDKTMSDRIKKNSIQQKIQHLDNVYREAKYNSSEVKDWLDKLDEANADATDTYNIIKDARIKTEQGKPPEGYGGYSPVAILSVEKFAEKVIGDIYDNYATLKILNGDYNAVIKMHDDLSTKESEIDKAIAQVEYEINYPDAEKNFAQLEGEAYAK